MKPSYPILMALLLASTARLDSERKTVTNGERSIRQDFFQNAPEAELINRLGDIDNLSFDFPADFDAFCREKPNGHGYPREPYPKCVARMDRPVAPNDIEANRANNGSIERRGIQL